MFTMRTSHGDNQSSHRYFTKALIFSAGLVLSTTQSLSAAESIPATPVDQLPQTIRTQLVAATGGATVTEVTVDHTHGDPQYVAHYRDPASKEMRTVTLGQTGNVIDSGVISVGEQTTTVGGVNGVNPDRVKPRPIDGPVPVTPPQRPTAPVMPEAPTVANASKDPQADPPKKPEPVVPAPPSSQTGTTDGNAKPFGIPRRDPNRDDNKTTEEPPKNTNPVAPESQNTPSPKKL